MEKEEFATYLEERYQDQIRWYDRKAIHNKKTYNWLQGLAIAFAVITPALIELNGALFAGHFVWSRLATLTAVVVAILSSLLKTFKYQENWINYRTTCETLIKEKHYYNARIGEYREATDPEAVFVERVENLISRENTLWLHTARQKGNGHPAKEALRP